MNAWLKSILIGATRLPLASRYFGRFMNAPFSAVMKALLSMSRQAEGIPDGVGLAILDIFRDWIARRHPDGLAGSERALALIEGLAVIDAAGAAGMVDRVVAALPR